MTHSWAFFTHVSKVGRHSCSLVHNWWVFTHDDSQLADVRTWWPIVDRYLQVMAHSLQMFVGGDPQLAYFYDTLTCWYIISRYLHILVHILQMLARIVRTEGARVWCQELGNFIWYQELDVFLVYLRRICHGDASAIHQISSSAFTL